MSNLTTLVITAVVVSALNGCTPAPTSGKGFTLPEGSVDRGQEAFVRLKCHACHSVSGVELPEIAAELETRVQLGGEVPRVSTYGELVTSIINPSHKLANGYAAPAVAMEGQSKMTKYNDLMTVQELTDLVAFLRSRYELRPIEPTHYRRYY